MVWGWKMFSQFYIWEDKLKSELNLKKTWILVWRGLNLEQTWIRFRFSEKSTLLSFQFTQYQQVFWKINFTQFPVYPIPTGFLKNQLYSVSSLPNTNCDLSKPKFAQKFNLMQIDPALGHLIVPLCELVWTCNFTQYSPKPDSFCCRATNKWNERNSMSWRSEVVLSSCTQHYMHAKINERTSIFFDAR